MELTASDDVATDVDRLSLSGLNPDAPPVDENACLFVSTTTWTRDSHELFDYEARQVHKGSYFLKKPARIFRTVVDVQVIPEGGHFPTQTADYLLSIRYINGRYVVVPADRNIQAMTNATILPKKIWLVVKDLPNNCHNLAEGDIVKLGRYKLKIRQLAKEGDSSQELILDDHEIPTSVVDPKEAMQMQCRICLLDGGTVSDPLVCPCNCKGSIKYVHLDCLRHWINGRLLLSEKDESQRMTFFFKPIQCELCKTPFPSKIILNNEQVKIVNIPKIEAPFIVLENIVGNANRGLHVISMEVKKELKLGRGHESDVRIADVSISRHHANIKLSDGEFILEDNNSKFGTLVSLRRVIPVEPSNTLAIQVGRTILNLSYKIPPCVFEDVLYANEDGMAIEKPHPSHQSSPSNSSPTSEDHVGNSDPTSRVQQQDQSIQHHRTFLHSTQFTPTILTE